ncbi:MAG TPA: MoaD/ThiS family protein [Planctomycetaceae bacterium]|nr:MoaD/ThiS family protein [Planctomycetaceae bacterium]HRF01164.1 MoaD/ThiS family protein [Pirellulaceae bacterium]
MRFDILLFAGARQAVSADRVTVDVPNGADIATLRARLIEVAPQLASLATRSRFAVDNRFVDDKHELRDGVEIALVPPVSGG